MFNGRNEIPRPELKAELKFRDTVRQNMKLTGPSLWHAVSACRRPLAGAFLLMLLTGAFVTFYQGRSFVGKTIFQVHQLSGSADVLSLLNSPEIFKDVAKTKKLLGHWNLTETEVARKLRGMVEISVERETDVISVEVYGADPVEAADLAIAVRDCFEERLRSAERERFAQGEMARDNKIKVLENEVEILSKELGEVAGGIMMSADTRKVSREASTDGWNRLKPEHASKLQLLEELKNSVIAAQVTTFLPRHPMEVLKIAKPGTMRVWRIPPFSHLMAICAAAVAGAVLFFRKGLRPGRCSPAEKDGSRDQGEEI